MAFNEAPKVGQTIIVRGMVCTIVKVRAFGTVDVETPAGDFLRVSGLSF